MAARKPIEPDPASTGVGMGDDADHAFLPIFSSIAGDIEKGL
jgi:hypothetical protein